MQRVTLLAYFTLACTAPETFRFRRNVWCDVAACRKPQLPTPEEDGTYLCDIGAEAYKRAR